MLVIVFKKNGILIQEPNQLLNLRVLSPVVCESYFSRFVPLPVPPLNTGPRSEDVVEQLEEDGDCVRIFVIPLDFTFPAGELAFATLE